MADPVWHELATKRRRMARKSGGRVEGHKSRPRLDKAARGGNDAKEEIEAQGKHSGDQETAWNFKKGGAARKKK